MAAYCGVDAAALLRDLETEPRSLDLAVRHAVSAAPHGTRFALVVDQFEELFTLCEDDASGGGSSTRSSTPPPQRTA